MQYSECTVSCYENEIPSFIENELDRLYGARYASLAFFRIYGDTEGASTYIARNNGESSAVFLYKHLKPGHVKVMNEGIPISKVECARFADYLFSKDRSVNAISFNYVETQAAGFAYPYQRMCCEEDLVLNLPETVDLYMASLGKATRSTLKNRINRIKRDFPSFTFSVHEKKDVDEEHVREIIRLGRLRMAQKNKISNIDEEEEQRIIACVKACGFVCVATIDGRVCAGSIAFRFGKNYTGRILAHDAAYDAHRLGFACAFLSICECIKRSGSERFYFGWGENDYKQHLGGKPRQLHRLTIYRSRIHVLANASHAFNILRASLVFHARQWILKTSASDNSVASYFASTLVNGIRRIKSILRKQPMHYRSSP